MIIKSFELSKVDLKNKKFFLLYGQNDGYKKQILEEKFKKLYGENIYHYEENEVLQNENTFFNNILSKSFFDNKKLIIINRATDKLKDIIKEVLTKKIEDVVFVLSSGILEKKSKLRNLFEKEKEAICVPFYEDNSQTLSIIVNQFFRNAKISISQQLINIIVERCRGDRINLKNELDKIQNLSMSRSKINIEDILKLTNLAENYSVSELVDSCLAKNKKKTIHILNENNYSLEDCILIVRTFLMKSKKLLKLHHDIADDRDIDRAISSFKPTIFWKDKDVTKLQIKNWSYNNIENLVYKTNEIELLIKKNSQSALNILSDFIVEQVSVVSN